MNQYDSSRSAQMSASLACAAIACISLAAAPQEPAHTRTNKVDGPPASPPSAPGSWCGARVNPALVEGGIAGGAQGAIHCQLNSTIPYPAGDPYAPTVVKFRIPVVFHVVHADASENSGGNLNISRVHDQIAALNGDFLSLPGFPGDPGIDVQIEFYLNTAVSVDGIMYHENFNWFNGNFEVNTGWSSTTVDARNNLNIFSMNLSESSGYGGVAHIPNDSGSWVGNPIDVILIDYQLVGNPTLSAAPFNQGRILTHEVGHWLGLWHTFSGGCAGGDTAPGCYTSGDAICDTPSQSQLFDWVSCGGVSNTCPTGGNDLVDNYMNYTLPNCWHAFSAEQVRRMRCTLMNWRPMLGETEYACFALPTFTGNFTSTPHTLNSHVAQSGSTVFTPAQTCPPGLTKGAGISPYFYAGAFHNHVGNEVAYRILHGGGDLHVDLTNLSGDLDLFLLGAAGTPASTLASSELIDVVDETVFLANAPPGVYYAVVDTYDPLFAGNFSLTYRGAPVGYNLDVNTNDPAASPGIGTPPSAAFGGAAAQPGAWNALTGEVATTTNLAVAGGFVTRASVTRNTAFAANYWSNNVNTTGEHQSLLDDGQDGATIYTFANLPAGKYRVFTYAIAPDSDSFITSVSVAGSPDGSQSVGGAMPANGFVQGVTHANHRVTVAPGGTIVVNMTVGAVYATTNGFQIKPQPECLADVTGNGGVDIDDLVQVITNWGVCPAPCPPRCAADIVPAATGNCAVNIDDLVAVIVGWGDCPD